MVRLVFLIRRYRGFNGIDRSRPPEGGSFLEFIEGDPAHQKFGAKRAVTGPDAGLFTNDVGDEKNMVLEKKPAVDAQVFCPHDEWAGPWPHAGGRNRDGILPDFLLRRGRLNLRRSSFFADELLAALRAEFVAFAGFFPATRTEACPDCGYQKTQHQNQGEYSNLHDQAFFSKFDDFFTIPKNLRLPLR